MALQIIQQCETPDTSPWLEAITSFCSHLQDKMTATDTILQKGYASSSCPSLYLSSKTWLCLKAAAVTAMQSISSKRLTDTNPYQCLVTPVMQII